MNQLGWATLALSTVVLGSAVVLGGTLGAGVLAGSLAGGALALAGVHMQRHVLATRPERALHAFSLAFLGKVLLLVLLGMALRFSAPLAARLDWRAFLLSYAGVVALLLPIGYHAVVTRWLAATGAATAGRGPR
jgi:hypothetical protein